jgi:uncharacterized protein RhaS with RHS repeats
MLPVAVVIADEPKALARYYDSRTGTFCSADPLAGSPGDPQSWNRYPYGRNDPIDVTDPSGKSWWSDLLIGIGVGVGVALAPELAPAWFGTADAGATVGTIRRSVLCQSRHPEGRRCLRHREYAATRHPQRGTDS